MGGRGGEWEGKVYGQKAREGDKEKMTQDAVREIERQIERDMKLKLMVAFEDEERKRGNKDKKTPRDLR